MNSTNEKLNDDVDKIIQIMINLGLVFIQNHTQFL